MEDNTVVVNNETGVEGQGQGAVESKESNSVTVDNPPTPKEEVKTEKTFTQAEVDKMIKDRLAREQKKAEEKRAEAEKLAQMNEKEKQQYEMDKLTKELNDLKAEKSKRELKDTALGILKEKNLDSDFAELLDYTDAEKCNASIETIEKIFSRALERAVDGKLKTTTVPKANESNSTGITKEQFNKMGYKEKLDLYNTDPDLYNSLRK